MVSDLRRKHEKSFFPQKIFNYIYSFALNGNFFLRKDLSKILLLFYNFVDFFNRRNLISNYSEVN